MAKTIYTHEQEFSYSIDMSAGTSLINFPEYQKRVILKDENCNLEIYTVYYVDLKGIVHEVDTCKNIFDKCTISDTLVQQYIR